MPERLPTGKLSSPYHAAKAASLTLLLSHAKHLVRAECAPKSQTGTPAAIPRKAAKRLLDAFGRLTGHGCALSRFPEGHPSSRRSRAPLWSQFWPIGAHPLRPDDSCRLNDSGESLEAFGRLYDSPRVLSGAREAVRAITALTGHEL